MPTIIIIRHGEKLLWPEGNPPTQDIIQNYIDDKQLSTKGIERAHALVGYFMHRREMQLLFEKRPLEHLIVQEPSVSGEGKSKRPRDTLIPLDDNLRTQKRNVPFHMFQKKDLLKAVEFMKSCKGSVICSWSHQHIQQMVSLLGVENVPEWPSRRFDVTWVVDVEEKRLVQLPQCLLYGDLPHCQSAK
ncbi:hypothetical protein EDD86DRAFT_265614 [Gorgonomyces haynaldii]|nr:hypothetical protein EDD86DRAFT_265614 [Gorgonomyces haynaldii]